MRYAYIHSTVEQRLYPPVRVKSDQLDESTPKSSVFSFCRAKLATGAAAVFSTPTLIILALRGVRAREPELRGL